MEQLTEQIVILEKGARQATQNDNTMTIRFRLMSAETENQNNRVYPKDVLAHAVSDLKSLITKRKSCFAACGHKDDMELDDVACVLEDITMEGLDVWATAKVLNTAKGRDAQAIIRGGGAVGVSARGNGAVKDGRVQPGFKLLGFDLVTNPGFDTFANKSNLIESVTVEDDGAVTEQQLREFGLENEETLKGRYAFAVSAGYKGTLAKYAESVVKKS